MDDVGGQPSFGHGQELNAGGQNKFAITMDALEESVRAHAEKLVIEIPANIPGRGPGDDDFARNLCGLINPGV